MFRWLMAGYGAEWSRWCPLDTLGERLSADALGFCREHRLALDWGVRGANPVVMAERYLLDIVEHLAHVQFGRPVRVWREDKARWYVGREVAVETMREQERLREMGAQMTNMRKAADRAARAYQARALAKGGMHVNAIADVMDCTRRSVERYLEDG